MKPGDTIGSATILAVKHGLPPAPARERKHNRTAEPNWAVASSCWWMIEFRVGCRVVSEANRREHWSKVHKRKRAQKDAVNVAWVMMPCGVDLEVLRSLRSLTVTLIHHGPKMDGDNLQRAFKAIRDHVAWILGVDDGDERVTWLYEQDQNEPGVSIRIEGGRKP